jgi:hypothetical protein
MSEHAFEKVRRRPVQVKSAVVVCGGYRVIFGLVRR